MLASCLQVAGLVVLAVGVIGGGRGLRFVAHSGIAGGLLLFGGVALQAVLVALPLAERLGEPLAALLLEYLRDTRSGRFAAGQGVLALAVATGARVAASGGHSAHRVLRAMLLLAVVLLALAVAAAGHAGVMPGAHGRFTVATQVVHIVCGVLWAALVVTLLLQWRAPATLRAALQRAGRQALPLALAVGVTGPVLAWLHGVGVEDIGSHPYGQLVAAKSILFAVVLILAAINRFHALGAGVAAARPRMATLLLAAEGVALVAILALASALAVTPPVH